MPRYRWTPEILAGIDVRLANGERAKNIAQEYGIRPNTLHNLLRHFRWNEEGRLARAAYDAWAKTPEGQAAIEADRREEAAERQREADEFAARAARAPKLREAHIKAQFDFADARGDFRSSLRDGLDDAHQTQPWLR